MKTSYFDIQFLVLTYQNDWGAQCLLCCGFHLIMPRVSCYKNNLAKITGFKWIPQGILEGDTVWPDMGFFDLIILPSIGTDAFRGLHMTNLNYF